MSLHGELLRTDLRIHNTGDEAFGFTAALHTYIEVLDIGVAKVRGLQGLRYLDKVRLAPLSVRCHARPRGRMQTRSFLRGL